MPQVGLHKGCCLDYLTNTKLVFDSFVTSPPYNVGMNYEGYSDSKSRVEYLRFMTLVARLSIQSAHEKTVFWLQLGPNRKDPQLPYDVLECFQYEGWTLVNQIVWLKSGTFPQLDGTEASFGHFRPIQSPTILHRGWEWVFMLTAEPKSGVKLDKLALGVPYKDQSNVKRFNHDQNLRCRGDVWFVPYDTRQKQPHPCAFPVALAENCLKLQGLEPGSLVCDPFCGTGATLRAAVQLGHHAEGCEISKTYHDWTLKDLQKLGYLVHSS